MGAKAVNLDFSGVKDRGAFNPHRVEEGDYAATIVKVEDAKANESGNAMFVFTIKLDRFSQYTYPYRCVLTDNQLWKLRNIAVAAGLNVPKKRLKFDPNKIVNKKVGVTLVDDDYEKDGKTIEKSEVSAVFPMSELAEGALAEDTSDDPEFDEGGPQAAVEDDDTETEEKPKKDKGKKDKGKKKGKKKDDGDVEELDITDIG